MVRGFAIALALGVVILSAARPALVPVTKPIRLPSEEELAPGRFLVSSSRLNDPNFRRTVVLLLLADADRGTIGIVINRRSKVSITRVFPGVKGPGNTDVKELAFAGGPVEASSPQALVRAKSASGAMDHVIGDVYATSDPALIQKTILAGTDDTKLRVYIGYAGWAADQLESEIELGAWSVVRATPAEIFDEDPDSLWLRLNRKAEGEIARGSGAKRDYVSTSAEVRAARNSSVIAQDLPSR